MLQSCLLSSKTLTVVLLALVGMFPLRGSAQSADIRVSLSSQPSVVTPKPANGGQGKTGQRKRPGTQLFYPATSCGGKSIFVRQLRGPHLRT
jgi:hypothetical protein